MSGKFKKRWYLLFLIVFLCMLVIYSDELGRLMYPIKYDRYVIEQSKQFGFSPYLLASIIKVESNFKPQRISRKQAVGLMQLMPSTANWIAEKTGQNMKDVNLTDPAVNIRMGSWYLNSIRHEFSSFLEGRENADRIAVIAAAYNAGPSKVKSWLINGQWDGTTEGIDQIPFGETRHYTQRVLYYYKKYEQFYSPVWES